jgi:hypothetical protein
LAVVVPVQAPITGAREMAARTARRRRRRGRCDVRIPSR